MTEENVARVYEVLLPMSPAGFSRKLIVVGR